MAEEVKRIIDIEAKYETLAELKQSIVEAREALKKMDETTEDYQSTLTGVKAAEREYNAQMRLAVKEYSNVEDKITVVKGSYNDLVNQLARLKVEWKQAVPGTDTYEQITREVNRIKDTLSGMDADIGNFQRNVGNYGMKASSSLGLAYTAMRRGATATDSFTNATRAASTAVKAFSKGNPLIGVLTLLMPLITKVSDGLKENGKVLEAGQKLLKTFEPLGNAIANVVEKIATVIKNVAGRFADVAAESAGTFKTIIAGAVGAGNVLLQYLLTPIRTIIDGAKGIGQIFKDIFTGDFKAIGADAKAAAADIAENFKQGFSFKANFNAGKQIGEEFISGITSAKDAGKEIGEEVADGVKEEFKLLKVNESAFDKMSKRTRKYLEEKKAMAEADAETLRMIAEQDAELTAEIDATSNELTQNILDDVAAQEKAVEDFKKGTIGVANAIASVLDSVAGAYQNEIKAQVEAGKITEQEGERQFENVKAMQIAVSTIQMLTGITTALSGAFTTKTGPWDIALAAAQAASIAASGIANISKISNTTLGNTQTSSAVGSGVQSVQTVAPAVQVAVPEYRTLTSASDEQSINDRYANQKVVLVTSELEAHNEGRKVKLAESTF